METGDIEMHSTLAISRNAASDKMYPSLVSREASVATIWISCSFSFSYLNDEVIDNLLSLKEGLIDVTHALE